jgi:hypothetical protein
MGKQGGAHRVSIGFPPTSRTLDVGEQKGHNARRRSPRGHSHRMSHNALFNAAIVTETVVNRIVPSGV